MTCLCKPSFVSVGFFQVRYSILFFFVSLINNQLWLLLLWQIFMCDLEDSNTYAMLFKSLDTKYIYKRYLHNSHLESQPNIISTVLMHLLRISLFIKFKCSEPNQAVAYGQEVTLWPQAGSHLAPRCSAAVHIALFGTLLLGLSVHIAYWSSHWIEVVTFCFID